MWAIQSTKTLGDDLKELGDIIAQNYIQQHAPSAQYEPIEMEMYPMLRNMSAGYSWNHVVIGHLDSLDRRQAISNMVHESTHHGQDLLERQDRSTLSPELQKKQDVLIASSRYHCSIMFGVKTEGFSYIHANGSAFLNVHDHLKTAFYRLSLAEREAREAELAIARQLGFKSDIQKDLDQSVDILRKRYMCSNWSAEQVYDLLDQAIVNVAAGLQPRDAREASITYDYAALLYEQDHNYKNSLEVLKMMSSEAKYNALADAGYDLNDPIMQKLAHDAHIKDYQPTLTSLDELFRDDSVGGQELRVEWKDAGIEQECEDYGRVF